MNTPKHTKTTIVRHEWTIGESGSPTTARDLSDGIMVAQSDMQALGIDTSYDDAYHVRAGYETEIVLFVDVRPDDE